MTFKADGRDNPIRKAVGKMVDSILRRNYTGPVSAWIYLCPSHRRWRTYLWSSMLGILGAALSFWAWLSFTARQNDPRFLLPILPMIIAGFGISKLISGEWNRWFAASRFDGRYVFLRGSSSEFRASLPSREGIPRAKGFDPIVQAVPLITPESKSSPANQPPVQMQIPARPARGVLPRRGGSSDFGRPPDYPRGRG
jgi:hypothetical protein